MTTAWSSHPRGLVPTGISLLSVLLSERSHLKFLPRSVENFCLEPFVIPLKYVELKNYRRIMFLSFSLSLKRTLHMLASLKWKQSRSRRANHQSERIKKFLFPNYGNRLCYLSLFWFLFLFTGWCVVCRCHIFSDALRKEGKLMSFQLLIAKSKHTCCHKLALLLVVYLSAIRPQSDSGRHLGK